MSATQILEPVHGTSSILRSSMVGLTPIRRKEIIKRSGIEFQREYVELNTDETSEPKTYEEYLISNYEMVLGHIDIPKHFDRKTLLDHYVKRAIERYDDDKEFKAIEEEIESSEGRLGPFIELINLCKTRHINDLSEEVNDNSDLFFITNIPFHVLTSFTRSKIVYGLFLNHLDNLFGYYNKIIDKNLVTQNRIKEDRYYASMKSDIDRSFEVLDPMLFSFQTTLILMHLWSSKNYDEIFNTTKIDMEKIPKNDFKLMYGGAKRNLKTIRRYILNSDLTKKYGMNYSFMPKPSFELSNSFSNLMVSLIRE